MVGMKKFMMAICATLMMAVQAMVPLGWALALSEPGAEMGGDTASGEKTDEIDKTDEMISDQIPEMFIKAINPGYKQDGKNNVGEMIEIARKTADAPISLAGIAVGYTNSSGDDSILLEFPENSWMIGENLLLRLSSSPDSELGNETYTKTLAMSAGLRLLKDGEMVDRICWTGDSDCVAEFKSATPTMLVRKLDTGEFEHVPVEKNYLKLHYKAENYRVDETEAESDKGEASDEATNLPSQCKGLQFSEILSYYETSKDEQFIEFYNPKAEQILLDGCNIRYKNKLYDLTGIVGAEGYLAYYPNGFNLTKNPTNSNTLELMDVNGEVVDQLVYPNGQRKATAYALIGYDGGGEEMWRVTYAPTPGEPNNYQEFKICEAGKVLNEATGNCVKVTTLKTTVCKEGYYLNVLTGRCNKIKTTAAKTCNAGYELNPVTNRCVKIKDNTGADYGLEPEEYEENSAFVALYAVLGVVGLGAVYLIYEFRHEFMKLARKVSRRFR